MPILRELLLKSGPFVSPFFIANPPEGFVGNWISVFIGVNGSGKSLLLRGLTDFALGSDKVLFKGRAPLIAQRALEGVSKVIALSGTPLDRFPRGGVPGFARKKPTRYDLDAYVYLGQRAPNGVVGAGQSERILAALLLRHARSMTDRAEQLSTAFTQLNLFERVGYRLTRTPDLNEKKLKNHPISQSALLERLKQFQSGLPNIPYSPLPFDGHKSELKSFVEWATGSNGQEKLLKALASLSEGKVAFSLEVEEHKPGLLPTITDWRCVLALGLADVSGLSFQRQTGVWIVGDDLSSGQWNWLTSISGVALEAEDDCLVLIDEPENSLHPEWQLDFIRCLNSTLIGRRSCHVVLATHSPLIASGVTETQGSVLLMSRSSPDSGNAPAITSTRLDSTFGWTSSDVYEHYFGLLSTRAPGFLERADLALSLVRVGISDNAQELSELVPTLLADVERFPAHDPMRSVVDAIAEEVANVSSPKSEDS